MTRPPGHAGYWGEPYQPERHSQQDRDGYGQDGNGSGDGYRHEPGSGDGYRPESGHSGPAWGYGQQQPDPYHRPESYDSVGTYDRAGAYDPAGAYDRADSYHRPETYDRADAYHRPETYHAPSAGVPMDEQPTAYLPAVPTIDLGDRTAVQDRPPGGKPTAGRATGRLVGVVAGVTTLLVAGLLLVYGSGVSGPDAPAHPDLVEPTKVVNQWLTAMFVHKDPAEMLRYTCKREARRAEVDKAINSVKKAERDAKAARVRMTVAWSKPTEVSKDDKQARVTSTLTVTIGRRVQQTPADFGLVFESGWRVCDADMP